ncbi:Flagellar hook-basal body complex protein FliE [hydrothermal vent metagenome]|uniref:Flagellar hook-basal body complex protein FliE n=1 Tax=hydrothermal vent metagenome TaxID=652676 RepID=A0A3B0RLF7_9ZZZZ
MIDAISKTSNLPGLQMTPAASSAPDKTSGAGGFEATLKNIAANSVDTVYKSEMTAIAGIKGQASVQQVVEQVMAAERTLQSTIAVRDKVVAAYQEISRMAI